MDGMTGAQQARVLLYVLGGAGGLACAGKFWHVPHRLARLLTGMMAAWALVCGVLASQVVYVYLLGGPKSGWLWFVAAGVLAAAPWALFSLFNGAGGTEEADA